MRHWIDMVVFKDSENSSRLFKKNAFNVKEIYQMLWARRHVRLMRLCILYRIKILLTPWQLDIL